MTLRRWLSFTFSLAVLAAGAGQAWAQNAAAPEPTFSLELNNASDLNGACRLIFVAINNTPEVLEKTAYGMAVFDDQQRVSQFLVFDFGRIAVGKTKVVQFDFDSPCTKISRLLVNDIDACVVGGQPSTICIDALKTATRTEIGFGV